MTSVPVDDPPDGLRAGEIPLLEPLVLELSIVTKDARLVRFGDVIKRDQLDFMARCQRQLDDTGQIRQIVLKARQIGISTVIEAITFVLTMLCRHFNAMVVSHENSSAMHILNMTRLYWETYPFKEFYTERYNGRSHLAWDNHSDLHIATAKNIHGGRSMTIQALHASEVAFWPDPETLYTGLAQAIPNYGLNAIFLESTANGVGNFFHKECNKAMRGESDFEFVFYPWWSDPEYTARFLPRDAASRYSVTGPRSEEEELLQSEYGISDDRLLWRRWAIANRCQGDVEKFHQEYPSTPHEAFIATGRNVFHLPRLLAHYQPRKGQRGGLRRVKGKITFQPDPRGPLTVYAHPSDDRDWGVYLCGGDPTHVPGGDYACVQVINRRTLEQVAVYRRKIDPINFGKDMQLIGTYYNLAMLAPEKEGPGYASVGCIVGDGYPRVYQTQRVDTMQGIPTSDLFGWATNVNTKELAIGHLIKLLSEPVVKIGEMEYGLVIHDEITLMELRDYVKTQKGLGYGNSDGSEYDDGVMALAIAVAVHGIEPRPAPYEVHPDMDSKPRLVLPTHGTGAVMLTQHERLELPSDDAVVADNPADDEPDVPPWQAWGRPREDHF